MPGPLIPLMLALGATGIASQVMGMKKNQDFAEDQASDVKKAQRRGAIERAMGKYGAQPAFSRAPEVLTPPDTSGYAAVSGLANLGMALTPQFMSAMKATPPVQIPPAQGIVPQQGLEQLGVGGGGLSPMTGLR